MANRPRNNTPPSSRKSRRNASTSSSSSSLSSLLPYFSSCVVSCPTACPGKRVGDRATATPMILCERGLVPRHKMLEKLVKGRRGGTEISRGKVERRNIRRTSGRTRLNERESCRSTGFLYFSARFCARFKRLHARATPQMSCYSKLADERGSSHVASTDVRPSELEDKTPVSREDSSLRSWLLRWTKNGRNERSICCRVVNDNLPFEHRLQFLWKRGRSRMCTEVSRFFAGNFAA